MDTANKGEAEILAAWEEAKEEAAKELNGCLALVDGTNLPNYARDNEQGEGSRGGSERHSSQPHRIRRDDWLAEVNSTGPH